ncbi:hypothetical protein HK100_011851 [Physocladia obscura]|uniref:Uncharacterized protein n=1 Tax=Physocladia obscura TaxID=109957 RepID=A0AAD5XI13_9FUNG|nr:hypothetical protein HK100_011851 [Physocladia obscura]
MSFFSLFTQTFSFPTWSPKTGLPSLEGKVALITGASTGLGKATALSLAEKGAHVFCVGRSPEKTKAAIADIISKCGNSKVEFLQADLMDLASVESAANTFLARNLPLHILVNNAGIMFSPWALSNQGIESQFATNHFAHVVLTSKLMPVLEKSQPSRIVVLSSIGHIIAIPFQYGIKYPLTWEESQYDASTRYGETKLANLHFARELQARIDEKHGADSKIFVNTIHPGMVATELTRSMNSIAAAIYSFVSISQEKGALTQTFVAGSEEIEKQNLKAKYFVPYCQVAEPSAAAKDKVESTKTWEWTENILKQQYKSDWRFEL